MDKRNHKERHEAGLKTRREVLGAEYVDKSQAAADDLSRKSRSMLNLAMLSALGRTHELKLHVNGALNNGLTKEEIREVFLQVAIYCGVPAAVESFRCAKEVFKERGPSPKA